MPKKNPRNLKKISASLILAIAMGLTLSSALAVSGYDKLSRKTPKTNSSISRAGSANMLQDAT
ncbi:MAG: hypothetical protein WCT08_03620 [Patescibacteria group bacterium]|jgi:hypothetical protein